MTLPLPPPTHTHTRISICLLALPLSLPPVLGKVGSRGDYRQPMRVTLQSPDSLLHICIQDIRTPSGKLLGIQKARAIDRCKVNEPQKYHGEQETRCERYVLCVLYEIVNQANSPRVTGQCVPGTGVLPAQGHKRLPEVMEMSCILIRTVAAQAYPSVTASK